MQQDFAPIIDAIDQRVIGKRQQVTLALTCLLAEGHLLIEDLPGMGKTTLAHLLAASLGLQYTRIQCTSDLLPSDITGLSVYNPKQQTFDFRPGPIFTEVLLADELNRTSPKTQSALLEAMEERQVTVDNHTYQVSSPFSVIATQNPSFQTGTYPLPESQLDRFLMTITLGYPEWQAEKHMLLDEDKASKQLLSALMHKQEFISHQQKATSVECSESIVEYILRLVTESRANPQYPHSISPRGSKALLKAAKSWAYIQGRGFVIPEDVQAVFAAVTEHRLNPEANHINEAGKLSQLLLSSVDPIAA